MKPCKPAVILPKAKFLYSRDRESKVGLYLNTTGVYRPSYSPHWLPIAAQLSHKWKWSHKNHIFQYFKRNLALENLPRPQMCFCRSWQQLSLGGYHRNEKTLQVPIQKEVFFFFFFSDVSLTSVLVDTLSSCHLCSVMSGWLALDANKASDGGPQF